MFHTRDAEQTLAFIASIVPRGTNIDDFVAQTSAGAEGTSPTLLLRMQESAARRLHSLLESSGDAVELQRAVDRARALALPSELIVPVAARVRALEEATAQSAARRQDALHADTARSAAARERYATLVGAFPSMAGLTADEVLRCPPEFICPITQEKMLDPVVASDGHSYERESILQVRRAPASHPDPGPARTQTPPTLIRSTPQP